RRGVLVERRQLAAELEERRLRVPVLEDREDLRRVGARPVVEGQRDLGRLPGSRAHELGVGERGVDGLEVELLLVRPVRRRARPILFWLRILAAAGAAAEGAELDPQEDDAREHGAGDREQDRTPPPGPLLARRRRAPPTLARRSEHELFPLL